MGKVSGQSALAPCAPYSLSLLNSVFWADAQNLGGAGLVGSWCDRESARSSGARACSMGEADGNMQLRRRRAQRVEPEPRRSGSQVRELEGALRRTGFTARSRTLRQLAHVCRTRSGPGAAPSTRPTGPVTLVPCLRLRSSSQAAASTGKSSKCSRNGGSGIGKTFRTVKTGLRRNLPSLIAVSRGRWWRR